MNTLWQAVPEALIYRLGWTLLHFVWEGCVIALIACAVLCAFRRRSANARYMTGCFALAVMMLAFAVTFASIHPPAPVLAETVAPPLASVPQPQPQTERQPQFTRRLAPAVSDIPSAAPTAPGARSIPPPPPKENMLATWSRFARAVCGRYLAWIVGVWMTGATILSLRLVLGWVQVQRLRREVSEPAEPAWQVAMDQLIRKWRVSRPVQLGGSAIAQVPMTIGWIWPVILLPVGVLTNLAPDQLRAILAHELAHIRRYDYLVNILQSIVETLLFYHPGVWWISRRIRLEREHCCDDAAVGVCGESLIYARALAQLESMRSTPPQWAAAVTGSSLLHRIQRILGAQTKVEGRPARGWAGLIALLVLIACLASYSVSRSSAAEENDPTLSKVGIRSEDLPKITKSSANLAAMARAIHRYQSEANQEEDASMDAEAILRAAIARGMLEPDVMVSPLAKDSSKPSYIWVKSPHSADVRAILAYEDPAHFNNQGTVALYVDGHAEYISIAGLQVALKQLGSAQGGFSSRPSATSQAAATRSSERPDLVLATRRFTHLGFVAADPSGNSLPMGVRGNTGWSLRPPRYHGLAINLLNGHDTARVARELAEIADLGADAVLIPVQLAQETKTSDQIEIGQGPPPAECANIAAMAHVRDLKVMLMPIVLITNPNAEGDWRGVLGPPDWDAWFANYTRVLLKYAEAAAQQQVEVFCIGSDLVSTERYTDRWRKVIADVRSVYHGKLMYSANWDHYKVVEFWDQLDLIGMSSYYSLCDHAEPTIDELLKAWGPIKKSILDWQTKINKPIVFTEAGWCSQEGCSMEPWNYYLKPKASPAGLEEQRRCYRAFLEAWKDVPQVHGVLWHEWSSEPSGPRDFNYTPKGKPAEQELRAWFREVHGPSASSRPAPSDEVLKTWASMLKPPKADFDKIERALVGTWYFDNPMGDAEQLVFFPDGRVMVMYSNGHRDEIQLEDRLVIKSAEYDGASFMLAPMGDGYLIEAMIDDSTQTPLGVAKLFVRIDVEPKTTLLRPLTGPERKRAETQPAIK